MSREISFTDEMKEVKWRMYERLHIKRDASKIEVHIYKDSNEVHI